MSRQRKRWQYMPSHDIHSYDVFTLSTIYILREACHVWRACQMRPACQKAQSACFWRKTFLSSLTWMTSEFMRRATAVMLSAPSCCCCATYAIISHSSSFRFLDERWAFFYRNTGLPFHDFIFLGFPCHAAFAGENVFFFFIIIICCLEETSICWVTFLHHREAAAATHTTRAAEFIFFPSSLYFHWETHETFQYVFTAF